MIEDEYVPVTSQEFHLIAEMKALRTQVNMWHSRAETHRLAAEASERGAKTAEAKAAQWDAVLATEAADEGVRLFAVYNKALCEAEEPDGRPADSVYAGVLAVRRDVVARAVSDAVADVFARTQACCTKGCERPADVCGVHMKEVEAARDAQRARAEAAERKLVESERHCTEALEQIDARTEQIEKIHEAFGSCEREWTNLHDLGDCAARTANDCACEVTNLHAENERQAAELTALRRDAREYIDAHLAYELAPSAQQPWQRVVNALTALESALTAKPAPAAPGYTQGRCQA